MNRNPEGKQEDAPINEVETDQPLRADVAKGLADVSAGCVKDFDAPFIVEQGKKLLAARRRFQTGELPDEVVEQVAASRMDSRHDHLNKLLEPRRGREDRN